MIIGNLLFSIIVNELLEVNVTIQKSMFEITCSDCGKPAMVPFKPTPGKPAYCRICFSKHTYRNPESFAATGNFNPKQAWAQRRENEPEKRDEKKSAVFRWSFATREETV